jgi:hypothetical protein
MIVTLGLTDQAATDEELKPVWPQRLRLEAAIPKPRQAPEVPWGLDAGGGDGAAQTAYQLRAATPQGGTVWDGAWNKAVVPPAPEGTRIAPELVQPCRVGKTLESAAGYEPSPGVYAFDLGKQIAGVCRFTVSLPEGHEIRLRHAQALCQDKSLDVSSLKGDTIPCFLEIGTRR